MTGGSSRKERRATAFAGLQGIWRSHGYGTLLEIGATRYRLYEETHVSCLAVFEGSLAELAALYVDLRVSPGRRAFSARRSTGVTRVKYRAVGALPRGAVTVGQVADPQHNFEVFWHTFAERYALFDLRGVDWQASYDGYRPLIHPGLGAQRLFDIFVDMLTPLRDGHVSLRAPFGRFSCGGPSAVQQRLAAQLGTHGDAWEVSSLLYEVRQQLRVNVRQRYLEARSRRAGDGLLEWGQLDDRTGYLALHGMAGLCGRAHRPREDQQAAASAMERVMRDLGHLPAMVVDLRDNGGGYDGVALRLAGYFIDRKRLAFTKAASTRAGHGGRQAVFVEPRGTRRYTGQLYLLTSGLTASAAEVFVLSLMRRPKLTRVGESTCGELSDAMERYLPNGWLVTLSNEVYRASDGELYEERGIPPHVAIPFPDRSAIAAGTDPAVDHVLHIEHHGVKETKATRTVRGTSS